MMINHAVDFGIVTALKIECDAVLKRLDGYELIRDENEPLPFYFGHICISGSAERYTVVVCLLLDMGNNEAAISTTRLLQRWNPANVLMLGIAGGVRGKVELGDVVVAKYGFYYESAKLTMEGEQMQPQHFAVDRLLFGRAYTYEATDWRGTIGVARPGEQLKPILPNVHFAPIASGEKVIADSVMISKLLQVCPKLVAVAMEGAGTARATRSHICPPRFLEVRGICDFADAEKNDDWHGYAANAAAAFVMGWLHDRPVPPLPPDLLPLTITNKPLLVLCAQSLRVIAPDEILTGFDDALRRQPCETVLFDFTQFVQKGLFINHEEVVQQLTNPQSNLLKAIARAGEVDLVFHGMVHIPLQLLMGHLVGNRGPVRLFDFNSNNGSHSWAWANEDESFPKMEVSGIPNRYSWHDKDIILRVSVSYPVSPMQTNTVGLLNAIEIDMAIPSPQWGIVRSERQVQEYGREFRRVLDLIACNIAPGKRIHLFYAGPNALGFHLGQQISENIHPHVIVWNYHRPAYDWAIDLATAYMGEKSVVFT